VNSYQLPVINQQPVILSRRRRNCLISHPAVIPNPRLRNVVEDLSSCACKTLAGMCFLFYVLLNRLFVKKGARPRTLKMQNKPKVRRTQIPITVSTLRTKDNRLRTAPQKNKPKQTQKNAERSEVRRLARRKPKRTQIDTTCHPERSKVQRAERSRRIYLFSHPDLSGFRIFDICVFIFDMLFMTNKPNFKKVKFFTTYSKKRRYIANGHLTGIQKQTQTNPISIDISQ